MENTYNIINDEIKPKRVYTEAQLRAVKHFVKETKILKNIKLNKEQIQKDHMKRIEKKL